MHLTAIFIVFNKAFFLVLSSSCKSVSIERKDSEDVPNIPIALIIILIIIITETQRHNRIAAYIHWKICKHYNIKVTDKYYEHEPKTATENNEATILLDIPIQTDREIKANGPDIVAKDEKQRTCQLIEISVSTERNTSIKTTEKLSKYKDLEIEIEKMWGMNTTTIPVVLGALGLVKKGMEKYISKIPGNISLHEAQKCVILGTAHILRRILSIE